MKNNDSGSEIINLLLESKILSDYTATDAELDNLITIISQSPTAWKSRDEIYISRPSEQPNSIQEKILKRRLKFAPNTLDNQQVRNALTLLVNFLSSNPNNHYQGITFNCTDKSYEAFIGLTDIGMQVICVLVGNHIPEYAFERPSV